jgi:hypothetical protein
LTLAETPQRRTPVLLSKRSLVISSAQRIDALSHSEKAILLWTPHASHDFGSRQVGVREMQCSEFSNEARETIHVFVHLPTDLISIILSIPIFLLLQKTLIGCVWARPFRKHSIR